MILLLDQIKNLFTSEVTVISLRFSYRLSCNQMQLFVPITTRRKTKFSNDTSRLGPSSIIIFHFQFHCLKNVGDSGSVAKVSACFLLKLQLLCICLTLGQTLLTLLRQWPVACRMHLVVEVLLTHICPIPFLSLRWFPRWFPRWFLSLHVHACITN